MSREVVRRKEIFVYLKINFFFLNFDFEFEWKKLNFRYLGIFVIFF